MFSGTYTSIPTALTLLHRSACLGCSTSGVIGVFCVFDSFGNVLMLSCSSIAVCTFPSTPGVSVSMWLQKLSTTLAHLLSTPAGEFCIFGSFQGILTFPRVFIGIFDLFSTQCAFMHMVNVSTWFASPFGCSACALELPVLCFVSNCTQRYTRPCICSIHLHDY